MGESHRAGATSDARANVVVAGSGPPVVLLHGLGGLADEVLAPLRFLARDNKLIAVDRPGYGLSQALPAEEMRPDRQAEWLASVLDEVGSEPAVVVAHSVAAAPALWLAHQHPERVAGLVLLAPFCRPTMPAAMPWLRLAAMPLLGLPLRRFLLPALARLMGARKLASVFQPNPVPPGLSSLPFHRMAQPSAISAMAAELRGYNSAMIPLALRLRRLQVRTVIVAGDRDQVAPWDRHALWAARRIPNSSGVCLRGVGHMIHHVNPAIVAAAIESARDRQWKSRMVVV